MDEFTVMDWLLGVVALLAVVALVYWVAQGEQDDDDGE